MVLIPLFRAIYRWMQNRKSDQAQGAVPRARIG
jgi:hypothetical protein